MRTPQGEFLGECDALTELAAALNRTDDAAKFAARRDAMAAKAQQHLWDASRGLYLNFQQDSGTFNEHSSPTSFYPMLSGTATQEQALSMTRRWLTNRSAYCVGDSSGSPPPGSMGPCRFGLPSTPNDDAAYRDNDYWRGRVWGPLNLLVYMGLRHPKYADLPEIIAARKQLVVQSREALLVEWLPKHHVHENLSPDTGLGDDVGSSNPMYAQRQLQSPGPARPA